MRKIVTLLFSLLPIAFTLGQEASYADINIPKVVPVSPNAAALGIYGAIPVGYYTGVPDINIPIYEIDLDGKKIPISISYHASGIKVAQEASTVGLGWVLNAGGCITRSVRGYDDFVDFSDHEGSHVIGYYRYDRPSWLQPGANNNWNNSTWDSSYFTYRNDLEPDMFYYNFAGYAGKLVFGKYSDNGNSYTMAKGIPINAEGCLDVTYDTDNHWKIIDKDGYTYYLGSYDTTDTYSCMEEQYSPMVMNYSAIKNRTMGHFRDPLIVTAWHIDSIVSPMNHKISFSYKKNTVYSPISVTEDYSKLIEGNQYETTGSVNGSYVSPTLSGIYRYYNYSFSLCEQSEVSDITFPNGSISFKYTGRLDLRLEGDSLPDKLSSITIHDNIGSCINDANFYYSYTGDTTEPMDSRLFLDSLIIRNSGRLNYTFAYNNALLPSKKSFSTDYWGYYNNSNIASDKGFRLSPSAFCTIDKQKYYIPGKDMAPDELCAQSGTLSSITYPTGGSTTFYYELNDFTNAFDTYKDIKMSPVIYRGEFSREQPDATLECFTVPKTGTYEIKANFYPEICHSGDVRLIIEEQIDNGFHTIFVYSSCLGDVEMPERYCNLEVGRNYRFRIESNDYEPYGGGTLSINRLDCDVSYISQTICKGGGLRVKSIKENRDESNYMEKCYIYKKDGESSGLLMTTPQHQAVFALDQESLLLDVIILYHGGMMGTYLNGFSTPYTPFSNSAMGMNVGYSFVEETISGMQAGRTEYSFDNKIDTLDNASGQFIKGYPSIPCSSNGKLLSTIAYRNDSVIIRMESFKYTRIACDSVKGLKFYYAPMITPSNNVSFRFYDIKSDIWLQTSKTESYLQNGHWNTTTTQYEYNPSNWLVKKETTHDSTGKQIETSYTYPSDVSAAPYTSMTANHILSPVIEQTETTNGTLTQKAGISYKDWGSGLFLPETIKRWKNGASTAESRLVYHNYDKDGHPLYVTKDNAENAVFLWSYNGQYPIASISGATLTEVTNAVSSVFGISVDALRAMPTPNEAKLKDGSLQQALPNAQVTTCTYKPLVGVASVTEPDGTTTYYEYDGLGRPSAIRDNSSKVTNQFEYHYHE